MRRSASWRRLRLTLQRSSPPFYINSIFGPTGSWLPPYQRFSEYSLLNPWRPLRMLKFLQNTWIPSLPHTPPMFNPPFLDDLFWQPTVLLQAGPLWFVHVVSSRGVVFH